MKLPSRLFISGLACAFALAAPGLLAAQAPSQGGEVYKSEDFGATWQEPSGKMTLDVFDFAFGPDRVYAAGVGGVWVLEGD